MPSRDLWKGFGKYGARATISSPGIAMEPGRRNELSVNLTGPEAIVYELNRIVAQGGIQSSVTTRRGLNARLRYLDSAAGRAELAEHGISKKLLRSWKNGKSKPSRKSLEKVEAAYHQRRRENVLRSGALLRILENEGRGRSIETHPIDQTTVEEKRRRNLNKRTVNNVRHIWEDLVAAYAAGDLGMIDDIYEDIIAELDSDLAAYAYVSALSIMA